MKVVLLTLIFVVSFSPAALAEDNITGTITYRQRVALPPDALVQVQLQVVSKADAPAKVIASQEFNLPNQVPIQFQLPYEAVKIDPQESYAIRADIKVGEKMVFVTDQHYPVLTRGNTQSVHLVLVPNKGVKLAKKKKPPSTPPLENIYWRLIKVAQREVPLSQNQREAHFKLNSKDKKMEGSGGCNRLVGAYQLKGDQLKFSSLATTFRMCLEGMDVERALLEALDKTRRWGIQGKTLTLYDRDGKVLAVFTDIIKK